MLRRPFSWISVLALLLSGCAASAAEAPRMSKEQLKSQLGKADVVVIDLRIESAWKASTAKVAGAVREDPQGVEEWAKKYPKDKTVVLYCS
jgi:hypothetical protein